MKKLLTYIVSLLIAYSAQSQVKVSQYPRTNNADVTQLLLLANTNVLAAITNFSMSVGSLLTQVNTNIRSATVIVEHSNTIFAVSNYAVGVSNFSWTASNFLSSSSGGSVTGTTNILQLSVQAAKLPTTNYPGIDAGWQNWELLYYKTNAEGSIASLSSTWQFIIPQDYNTNTFKVRVYSTLSTTNGPNSSNTIFRASVIRAVPGDTTDLHTASFGTAVSGTNTWTASGSNTNKVQQVVINMSTTSAIAAGDLVILKLDRDSVNDTFGGVTPIVGLQLEYTRK